MKRYRVAIFGILFHLMIGSVYAWSVFTTPIAKYTDWSEADISISFSIAIFFLGMSAAFMGKLVEKFGPRKVGTISSVLFGIGIMMTGLAIQTHHLWLLYLSYGVIGGLGLGSGYVTPVSTIIKWFPDKKGLATGLAIMGFGFSSLLVSPIAQFLITTRGIISTFYILGFIYLIVMLISAQFIQPPKETDEVQNQNLNEKTLLNRRYTANEAVKTSSFRLLWILLFINITCGIALVSAASPMGQSLIGMSPEKAAIMVGIMGLFNGFGRLLWATLSDYIGRPNTFTIVFCVNIIMLGLLFIHNSSIFTIAMCILMSCYGAGFSIIPAYLGDVFGTKELSAIHGYALTAWACAGICGPILLSVTHEWLGTYSITLILFILLNVIAVILSILIRKNFKN